MNRSTKFVGIVDKSLLSVLLLLTLLVFFSQRMGNILWGGVLALPVTALLLYALWLNSRRRGKKSHTAKVGAWHLHNLLMDPADAALHRVAKVLAAHYNFTITANNNDHCIAVQNGRQITLRLLQLPEDCPADSAAILAFHRSIATEYSLLVSTSGFSEGAKVFARRLQHPIVRLIGPETLLPLLSPLPAPDEAVKNHTKQKNSITWSTFLTRIKERERSPRYLIYGLGMLAIYIIFNQWPFLIPGLACIFLAVISRRQPAQEKKLFDE